MKSFGKLLKKERELRGITLEEVADYTKVGLRYLKAIEADDLKSLPATTFIRGFLKSYARFIGLNPEEVVFNFDQFVNRISQDTQPSFIQTSPFPKKGAKFFYVFTAVLVPLLVLAFGYSLHTRSKGSTFSFFNFPKQAVADRGSEEIGSSSKNEKAIAKSRFQPNSYPLKPMSDNSPLPYQIQLPHKDESMTREDAVLVRSQDQGIMPVDNFQKSLPSPSTGALLPDDSMQIAGEIDGKRDVSMEVLQTGEESSSLITLEKPLSNEIGGHTLEIACVDRSWVRVLADKEKVFEGILEPPVVKVWYAKEKFTISTGNAGGIELKLDNQKLPPLGKRGEVVTSVTLPKIASLSGTNQNRPTSSILKQD